MHFRRDHSSIGKPIIIKQFLLSN